MAQQLDFAVGASVILIPQYGVPVFLATAIGKLVLKIRKRRVPSTSEHSADSNGKQQVSLQWSHVSCCIRTKTGETKQILADQSAVAKPSRCGLSVAYTDVETHLKAQLHEVYI